MRPWLYLSKPLRPPFADGTSVLVRTLVRHLPREVELAYLGDPSTPLRLASEDLVIEQAAMGHAPSLMQKVSVLAEAVAVRNRHRALHFFFTPNPLTSRVLAGLKALNRRRPIVQTVTSSHEVELHARLLRRLDAVIVMSQHTRHRLIHAGLDEQQVHCIYPSVAPCEHRARVGAKRLLYAGDLDMTTAARLCAIGDEVASAGLDWTLVIACRPKGEGDAQARELIEARLATLMSTGQVELLGRVEDFEALRLGCELQLFVADHVRKKVDLPLVVLEGLARGQGLLCLDFAPVNELRSLAQQRGLQIGAFVEASASPQQIADFVVARLKESDAHERWAQDGPRLVESVFEPGAMARAHGELYARLN